MSEGVKLLGLMTWVALRICFFALSPGVTLMPRFLETVFGAALKSTGFCCRWLGGLKGSTTERAYGEIT